MKTFKYLVISFFSILILLFIYLKLTEPKSVMMTGDKVSLENAWKKPTEAEYSKIESLLIRHNFNDCEDLFLKKVDSETLLIACLTKDKNWNYYYSFPKTGDLYLLSDEVKKDIEPPR